MFNKTREYLKSWYSLSVLSRYLGHIYYFLVLIKAVYIFIIQLECPSPRVSPTGEVLGNMNNEGAKRLLKCFGSDPLYTQAVCENGQWTGANCLGIVRYCYGLCFRHILVSNMFSKRMFLLDI